MYATILAETAHGAPDRHRPKAAVRRQSKRSLTLHKVCGVWRDLNGDKLGAEVDPPRREGEVSHIAAPRHLDVGLFEEEVKADCGREAHAKVRLDDGDVECNHGGRRHIKRADFAAVWVALVGNSDKLVVPQEQKKLAQGDESI